MIFYDFMIIISIILEKIYNNILKKYYKLEGYSSQSHESQVKK